MAVEIKSWKELPDDLPESLPSKGWGFGYDPKTGEHFLIKDGEEETHYMLPLCFTSLFMFFYGKGKEEGSEDARPN